MDFKKLFIQLVYVLLSIVVAYLVSYFNIINVGLNAENLQTIDPSFFAGLTGGIKITGSVFSFLYSKII